MSGKRIDITGLRFGKLIVKKLAGKHPSRKENMWECECDCGGKKLASYWNLKIGKIKSCGCIRTGTPPDFSLIGKIFGVFTVISRTDSDKWRGSWWLCSCPNGHILKIQRFRLMRNLKSCKCCRPGNLGELSGYYWKRLKSGAKSRNIQFEITQKEALDLFYKQDGKCALTGVEINIGIISKSKYPKLCMASLDRKDSSKGYSIENVQWVHKEINIMKGSLKEVDFIKWCKMVSDHCK